MFCDLQILCDVACAKAAVAFPAVAPAVAVAFAVFACVPTLLERPSTRDFSLCFRALALPRAFAAVLTVVHVEVLQQSSAAHSRSDAHNSYRLHIVLYGCP